MRVAPRKVEPNNLQQPWLFPELKEVDDPIKKTKNRIKDLIAENRLLQGSRRERLPIQLEIVEAYKTLSELYENESKERLHYKKVYEILKGILFNGTNKNPDLNTVRKIRENISMAAKDIKEPGKRAIVMGLARNINVLIPSIRASEALAQQEFPINDPVNC